MKPRIAVIFPSRGLSFSQTCEELLDELRPYDHQIFFAHGKSIPACFNTPLNKALKGHFSHIWFVEDDMVLSEGILARMLAEKAPVVACDYPLTDDNSGTIVYDPKGKAYFTGTGCLLIGRSVFNELPRPLFRSDLKWRIEPKGYGIRFTAEKVPKGEKVYGYHDVTLGLMLYVKGIPITVVDGLCYQRKLTELGGKENNVGGHAIKILSKYKKQDYSKDYYTDDYKEEKTVGVKLKRGRGMIVPHKLAEELVSSGRASYTAITRPNVVIDLTNMPSLIEDFE